MEDSQVDRDIDPRPASAYSLDHIGEHILEERERSSLLGEVREIIFGAQDGLVSTLVVVATVAGASTENIHVLIAGLATAMAGIFSMAVGEYIGSKSQAEINEWQIADEREEVRDRPGESEAEVIWMFMREGMSEADAREAAGIIARSPDALLATMVNKELGLPVADTQGEYEGTPLRGALFMGGAFALGSVFPLLPFFFTSGPTGVAWAMGLTAAVLFGIGTAKARFTHRFWLWSGLEVMLIATVAGIAGYFFGTVLPNILGFAATP